MNDWLKKKNIRNLTHLRRFSPTKKSWFGDFQLSFLKSVNHINSLNWFQVANYFPLRLHNKLPGCIFANICCCPGPEVGPAPENMGFAAVCWFGGCILCWVLIGCLKQRILFISRRKYTFNWINKGVIVPEELSWHTLEVMRWHIRLLDCIHIRIIRWISHTQHIGHSLFTLRPVITTSTGSIWHTYELN